MELSKHNKEKRDFLYSGRWKYLFVLSLFWLTGAMLTAQIGSSSYNFQLSSDYPNHPENIHPIFVFCASNISGDITGSLSASHPDDAVSDYDFEWRKYDPGLPGFGAVFSQDIQTKTSIVNNLESGGYQVEITNGDANDTTLIAWIFINKPEVSVSIKNLHCTYVALEADTASKVFAYFDPDDHTGASIPNDIDFEWSSIPISTIPWPTLELQMLSYELPYEDLDYYLTVTDRIGCVNEDSLFYHSIHAKADFAVEPAQGEAPLDVTFTNESLNAVRYEWHFGDDSTSILENPDVHTYYVPKPLPPEVNGYEAKLTVWSQEDCIDSSEIQYIIVDPSMLDIPNVFTPNNDTYNDRFIVSSQSLRSIYVQIFSRTGKKVYEFSGQGTKLQEWKGWDGKVNGDRDASPGVYFYIIRAVGWDDKVYRGITYRGTLQLIREK